MAAVTPKGLDDTAIDRLILRGQKFRAAIQQSVLDAQLERGIQGPSTITATIHDPNRELIRSPLVNRRSAVHLDGMGFDYIGYRKSGDALEMLFEDGVVADLKGLKPGTTKQKEPLKAAPGTMTRTRFAKRLVEPLRYVTFRGEPTDKIMKALAQGKRESAWKTLVRISEERAWRCFVAEETLFFGSDDWLGTLGAPHLISESDDGIDYIDPDYNGGKRATTATVSCYVKRWAARPGAPVRIQGLGELAGKGLWLVESISRSLFSPQGTIMLIRKTPDLPEPAPDVDAQGHVGGDIVAVGQTIQKLKGGIFSVGEHPRFGGVAGSCNNDPHVTGSHHCRNLTKTGGDALDINWRGGGGFSNEQEALEWLEDWIRENVTGIDELMIHVGTGLHLHLSLGAGGGLLVASASPNDVGPALKAGFRSVGREDLAALVDHEDFWVWVRKESGGDFGIVSPANNNGKVNGGGFQFWAGHAWAVPFFTKGVSTPGSAGNRFAMSIVDQAVAAVKHFGLTSAEVHRYADQIRSGSYGGWG